MDIPKGVEPTSENMLAVNGGSLMESKKLDEDEKSEFNVIPPLKDPEGNEDLIRKEGLINPNVL